MGRAQCFSVATSQAGNLLAPPSPSEPEPEPELPGVLLRTSSEGQRISEQIGSESALPLLLIYLKRRFQTFLAKVQLGTGSSSFSPDQLL